MTTALRIVLLVVAFLVTCSAVGPGDLSVVPASASIQVGQSVHLQAVQDGRVVNAQWSSSQTSVATVTSTGLVTGRASGEAVITARKGHWRASAVVTVSGGGTPPPAEDPPVSGDSCPSSAVDIWPGQHIQSVVEAHSGETTFCVRSGIHRRQQVTPKSGNVFVGEVGAVLDGESVTGYAFETLGTHPVNVTIQGLEIRQYATPGAWLGAIQGDNGTGWVVRRNVVHHNAQSGIRPGKGWLVSENVVSANSKIGIACFRCDGVVIEGNTIHGTNTANTSTGGESGIKILAAHDVTIRANYVHHNNGIGIWTDTNYLNTLIEDNRVEDNSNAGIWHEISYDAIIRHNTVARNGRSNDWIGQAGIQVSNSPDVQIYGNTVTDNANGITVMQAPGYTTSGPYGPYGVMNLLVRDNVVQMSSGVTGMSDITGEAWYDRNNRFEGNAYMLGSRTHYFTWDGKLLTEAEWQGYGLDVDGTFTR